MSKYRLAWYAHHNSGQPLWLGGGLFVEAMGHVEFLLPPFTVDDVVRTIDELCLGKLLVAQRGMPDSDRGALVSVVCALGELGESSLAINQIEINPLVITAEGEVLAIDAVVVLD